MAVIICKTCGEQVEIDESTGKGQCKKCKNLYELEKRFITSEEFNRIVIDDTAKLPNIINMIRTDCQAENYTDALTECKRAREIKADHQVVKFYYALTDYKVNQNVSHMVEYLRTTSISDIDTINEILPILFSLTDNDNIIQQLPIFVANLNITDEVKQLWINEYQITTYAKNDLAKKVYIGLSSAKETDQVELFKIIFKQCKNYDDFNFIMKLLIKKSNKVSTPVLTLFFNEAIKFLRSADFSNKDDYLVIREEFSNLKKNYARCVNLGFTSPEVYKNFLNMDRALEISRKSYRANLRKSHKEKKNIFVLKLFKILFKTCLNALIIIFLIFIIYQLLFR